MIEIRRFERINDMIAWKTYIQNEMLRENKEFYIYGFKYIKTDEFDNYILIGCESDDLYESDNLFNFWSNKFINKEIEIGDFTKTGWFFITLVKRNNVFQKSEHMLVVEYKNLIRIVVLI